MSAPADLVAAHELAQKALERTPTGLSACVRGARRAIELIEADQGHDADDRWAAVWAIVAAANVAVVRLAAVIEQEVQRETR